MRKASLFSDFMDLKDFLKPTKAKLLAFVVCSLLFGPILIYSVAGKECYGSPGGGASGCYQLPINFDTYVRMLIHFLSTPLYIIVGIYQKQFTMFWFGLLIPLLTYIIACAIVMYIKTRKKPKKRKKR